ncbi:hypothetical protein CE91St1_12100 [Parabacteroides goldsteinii]|nr:hypothetical protein CE91St1_12100 [Parabacteroides goldsteinii]GKG78002.1 hypothetical protein CE91St2_11940 [Parabacteroides goldsteinii]
MKKYVAEMIGTIIGSSILFILAKDSGSTTTLTGVNGYHDLVPAFVAETVFTFIFLLVVLGSTSKGANTKFAGIAIGFDPYCLYSYYRNIGESGT